jgi:hypothetical protein
MDAEDKRLINGLLDNTTCYLCGSPISVSAEDLNINGNDIYVTDYYCTGCDVGYDIEVEDIGHMFSLSAYRMDTRGQEPDFPEISRSARKEALQEETHPMKDLVEGLGEMTVALTILQENRDRIHESGDVIREEGFKRDPEFDTRVTADLHNYMASAYSFEEVLETVEPNLPTGGQVESAKDSFDEENMLIKGLRTYVQHHLTLPHSFSDFYDENTGQREVGIIVSMEDVGEDGVEDFQYGDPSISFEKVEGDTINLERRIDFHYESAEELVRELYKYTESAHEDELEDYYDSTSYNFN